MSENNVNSTEEIVLSVEMGDAVSAQTAEAYAVGKRGGVDVAETDPTWHNNAKYYAEQAEEAAGEAQGAEEAAQRAETAQAAAEAARDRAEAIGAGAAQSAAAAAESAQAAATAKTGAETAQSAAAGSATAAEGSAGRASQSATAAAGSATAAGTAKTAAETARDAAAGSATAAAGSASAADQSAQAAAASAQAAEDVAESIPADYSQLSDDVSGLKSAINLLGDGLFAIMGKWENGDIVSATGEYTTSHAYRIATIDKVTTTKAYDFTIASGFQIYFYLFDAQGNITKKSGWTTGSYSVASGAIYRAVIARTTEDTSEIADVTTFRQSVTYNSAIEDRLSEAESDISALESSISTLTVGVSLAKAEATELGIYGKTLVTVGDIINGNISTAGTPSTSATYNYMVFTSTMLHFLVPLTLTFDAGYSGVVHFYNSATMTSANHKSSTSVTNGGSVEIPSDSYFAFRMQRYPADTTTDFSPSEASYHIYFKRKGDVVLPSEWLTYLATKEPQIKTAMLNLGSKGISFVFVTDVHIPRNNMLTPQIIQTLKKSVYVDYYINGGDFLDLDTDSAQTALDRLWLWRELMNGTNEICIRGNHDNNNYNGDNASKAITEGQFYAIFDRPIEKEINTNGKTYFCVDNESQKVRLIFLDNLISGADRNTMYSWMQTKLTELDSSWTILVIEHYIWGSTTETISTQGQLTIDAINAVYSNINAEFIGILAGHTHIDNNATESVNGYYLIARDTNMIKSETGTNALSFDYVTINTLAKTINFTKVGRGSDLSLSY